MADCDKVIELSLQHFNKLKATLKPNQNEFTSFASIVARKTLSDGEDEYQLISLALGTRSIAGEKAKLKNLIIDMHAESINRRAFKYYLAKRAGQNLGALRADLERTEFHLLISQLPCGVVNRYRGSDNLLRKKPGRGEDSKKATCFDKLLKWTLLGLQGRKLFSILSKPIRFKSIIIGNCSLEMTEQDRETFRRGLGIDLELVIRWSPVKENRHDEEDSVEGPKRKKLKPSDRSDDAKDDHSDKLENTIAKEVEKHCEDDELDAGLGASDRPAAGLFEPVKPEIHFSDTFVNELFTRKDGKKAQDKSVVFFLDPKERLAQKADLDDAKQANAPEKVRPREVISEGDAKDPESGEVKADNVQAVRPTDKPKRKDEYRLECIQDGRKLGSTKKNYERLLLALSPSGLKGLILSALEQNAIDLTRSESIEAYDSAWDRLRKHPNFIRWTSCDPRTAKAVKAAKV